MLAELKRLDFKTIYALLVTLCVLIPHPGFALTTDKITTAEDSNSAATNLNDQRYHYELAKSALSNGDFKKFKSHYAKLADYPLVPYLDYAQLKYNLTSLDYDKVDTFLEQQQGSFLEIRLREQLLYTLAVKRQWKKVLSYYQENQNYSKEITCFWLYARIQERDDTAFDEVANLWVVGKSIPEACDPLISRWQKEGHLTQDLVWQRFLAAMDHRNKGLARYLTGLMSPRYHKHAQMLLEVDSYPHKIRQHRRYSDQTALMQAVIVHGISRYARKNPKDALYHWELYEAQQLFPQTLSTAAKLEVIRQLTRKGETDAVEKLIKHSRELQENSVVEAFIRESLKQGHWDRVLTWLDKLDDRSRESARWQYWRARAMEEANLTAINDKSPKQIYKALSKQRSFYGFLAADKIGSHYSLEHIPVEITSNTLSIVESLPGMRRAKELWLTDNRSEAHAEWVFATSNMGTTELIAAGELAKRWGWYNRGIQAMITGNLWDHLSIRFPLAYEPQVLKAANDNNIEPTLIFAIARQESAFAENAKSSAGAMGLMQLMPSTAQMTARNLGIKHNKKDLFKAEHNIGLGSSYLNELLNQYNGNRILATAAYNAGPHRVDRWLRRTPQDVAFDIWIETIPFKETRGYVQNVLSFSVIYGYRLGTPRSLVTESEAKSLL